MIFAGRKVKKQIAAMMTLVLMVSAIPAMAADTGTRQNEFGNLRGLQFADWVVMGIYAAGMLAVGVYFARRQKNMEEFFLAGRSAKPFMVGMSLFASLISTISYLAWPGEMIKHGPIIMVGIVSIPVIYLLTGYALIPFFMKLPITSAYEILERRFGMRARLLGSTIFVATRLVWMGLFMYLAGKAIVVMLGWPQWVISYVIIITGVVTVVYSSIGGFSAVIITDVFQAFILMTGAVLTVVCISISMGGVGSWWPHSWASNWDQQPFFSLNPEVRVTVVGTMVAYFVWWICTACSDQMAIQRYLATKDAKSARRAFLINNTADVLVSILLALVGFALLGYFRANPQLLDGKDPIANADFLFPHYIANFLPMGVGGLVVSGMFAAAMGCLSSGISSVTAVLKTDFWDRFGKRSSGEGHQVKSAKVIVVIIGIVVLLLSTQIGKVPGNILEVANKTVNLFVGPMGALFVMALFMPWVDEFGAIAGTIYGCAVAMIVAYWDVITGRGGLSFQWIMLASLIASLIVGSTLSLVPIKAKSPGSRILRFGTAAIPLVALVALILHIGKV
ncbi:MAG: hypothetical protein A2Y07_10605 [Planctomycetes bacterium GWF2_50_10]|nr:MAG: hypothetical protein A2Y07_10605 [Planctomycetes bacterium GWF2_50_10]